MHVRAHMGIQTPVGVPLHLVGTEGYAQCLEGGDFRVSEKERVCVHLLVLVHTCNRHIGN